MLHSLSTSSGTYITGGKFNNKNSNKIKKSDYIYTYRHFFDRQKCLENLFRKTH